MRLSAVIVVAVALVPKEVAACAIPFGFDEPEPFETRFTMRGILGRNEYMVGEEYWDFLGDPGAYTQVLEIFDQVGREHWDELNHLMTGN